MSYPANYDITILQNATWRAYLRVTQERQPLDSIDVVSSSATFVKPCHKLLAGDKVVLTSEGDGVLPCGLDLNKIYYVISSGLTTGQFKVSETFNGAELVVSGSSSGTFYVAKPVDLSGYVVDSDIRSSLNNFFVATFARSTPSPTDGEILISMAPAVSSKLDTGKYNYDVSITSATGERDYLLTGVATVQGTYSRN